MARISDLDDMFESEAEVPWLILQWSILWKSVGIPTSCWPTEAPQVSIVESHLCLPQGHTGSVKAHALLKSRSTMEDVLPRRVTWQQ